MELREFGSTGIAVPAIGMGTWRTFDARTERDLAVSRSVVDAAIDSGTTLFDTSPMYGESERVLGVTLEGRRENVLIADKVWASARGEAHAQIERALGWFGGTVDIYQVHNLLAADKHLPVLEDLRSQGRIRVIGATHYKTAAYAELMTLMRTRRIQMIQIPYNTADRAVEKRVLPLARDLGIGVIVMKPLGTGSIVGRSPTAADLEPLARFGVRTWAQALLKWVLSEPRVHCAIPATTSPLHASENAAAGDPPWFDPETREYVARLAGRG